MIRDAATAAHAQAEQLEAEAEQRARDELIARARRAIELLPAPDGTLPLDGKLKDDKKAPAVHVDPAERLAVIADADGDVAVAVRELDDGTLELRLVELVDGTWTRRSGPLESLADLGAAIEVGQ